MMSINALLSLLGVFFCTLMHCAHGFVPNPSLSRLCVSSSLLFADMSAVRKLLEAEYPHFDEIVGQNDYMWKQLSDAKSFTIFVPNQKAYADLGAQKQEQLQDPRNLETTNKIGLFHAVNERVSAKELFDSGGIITMGDQVVPVGRQVTGGFFGLGGTEDGGVTVGGCNVVQSRDMDGGIVHEVDGFISPQTLWRYMDQLRIPGSR